MKQPYTKSYTIKGAQFTGGVTANHVTPEVDVIMDCDALHTAEETRERERERVVALSTVSVTGGALLPTPSDKMALTRTRLRKASEWLGVHLFAAAGTTSATVQERTRARPRREGCRTHIPGKLHLRNIPPVLSRPSGDSQKSVIALQA